VKVLRFNRRVGAPARCRLHLAAQVPGEGFAFSFFPVPEGDARPARSRHRMRAGHGDDVVAREFGLLRRLAEAGLTPREAEVVAALLHGDRTPGIARKLYLTPGTVRNHLSSAFRKFGVTSQQELVDVLRLGID
jgi:DNA-binding CsgD family transcriptional regulator